jgi:hypothetical protein
LADCSRVQSNAADALELAFAAAELHLGIPRLLDAADFAGDDAALPDEPSMLTYLAHFVNHTSSNFKIVRSTVIQSPIPHYRYCRPSLTCGRNSC